MCRSKRKPKNTLPNLNENINVSTELTEANKNMTGNEYVAYEVSEGDVHIYDTIRDVRDTPRRDSELHRRHTLLGVIIILALLLAVGVTIDILLQLGWGPDLYDKKEDSKTSLKIGPEKPDTGTKPSKAKCEFGWDFIFANSKCYKYFPVPRSWQDARLYCKSKGGILAEPRTFRNWQAVINYMSPIAEQQNVWMGGREWKAGCSTCKRQGTLIERRNGWYFDSDDAAIPYKDWEITQPDSPTETCLHLYRPDKRMPYQMADGACFSDGEWRLNFLCEKKPTVLCETGNTGSELDRIKKRILNKSGKKSLEYKILSKSNSTEEG